MKKSIPIIVISIIAVLIVAYFIFNYTVEKITEREVKRITQGEIDKATGSEIGRLTKEITDKILGGGTTDQALKEVNCDNIPTQRKFSNSPYYSGPLIDDHLHMPFTFKVSPEIYAQADWDAPILEVEVLAGNIICDFDKEKTSNAFGFYVVPSLLKGQTVQLIKQVEQQYPGRIIPFLMPAHVSGFDLGADDAEDVLDSNKGLFKGFGEIAFYKGSYKGVSPDDPALLEIYKIADKYNLIVMIHPDDGQKQAIEKVLQENPNVKFLFHGDQAEIWIIDILNKYPNAYYSVDSNLFDIPNEYTIANIYGPEKEEFISELRDNFDKILKINLDIWKPRIEKYPDRFLWGTDRAWDWHFDPEVGALLEEMSRSFIGQLDPAVQEKFAYQNAERMIAER
ncbi:MAG: amidohydrolase family protein [Nanoarchaeota archaeon]|nr:amidohydrolase family protein [Nanoarchaeota archaeon]